MKTVFSIVIAVSILVLVGVQVAQAEGLPPMPSLSVVRMEEYDENLRISMPVEEPPGDVKICTANPDFPSVRFCFVTELNWLCNSQICDIVLEKEGLKSIEFLRLGYKTFRSESSDWISLGNGFAKVESRIRMPLIGIAF